MFCNQCGAPQDGIGRFCSRWRTRSIQSADSCVESVNQTKMCFDFGTYRLSGIFRLDDRYFEPVEFRAWVWCASHFFYSHGNARR